MNPSHLMSQSQSSNLNNNIFQYFLFFLQKTFFFNFYFILFQLTKHVFDFKNTKFFFSFYSQKQVFENRKQKLLSNIVRFFAFQVLILWRVGLVARWVYQLEASSQGFSLERFPTISKIKKMLVLCTLLLVYIPCVRLLPFSHLLNEICYEL